MGKEKENEERPKTWWEKEHDSVSLWVCSVCNYIKFQTDWCWNCERIKEREEWL